MKVFEAAYAIVRQVPAGRVTTYGQVARLLGDPRLSRAVGYAMRVCPPDVPFWRVVKKDGTVAGSRDIGLHIAMLESENVPFLPDGRIDMEKSRWNGEEQ